VVDCHLQRLAGAREACTGSACLFWESSRTEGNCGIEKLALGPDDREVVAYLLDVRARLMSGHAGAEDAKHAAVARRLGRDA
jgi:hypothetical protein